MRPFKIIGHTADLRLQVFGHDYEELFQNAALALASILRAEERKAPPEDYEKIEAAAPDLNSLLINFLNEVLTRSQVNRKVYRKVKFLRFSEKSLVAQIFGRSVDRFDEDVKAVTYHGAAVEKNKRGIFQVTLILDI